MLTGNVIIQGQPRATVVGRPDLATIMVVHFWSNADGWCKECGNPAAFFLPRAYINETHTPNAPDQEPTDTNKRCAVCAANAAADGSIVRRIHEEQ